MAVALYRPAADTVVTGGTPVTALYGPFEGAIISNPPTAALQGIAAAESIFVDLTGPASLVPNTTTVEVGPGGTLILPDGDTRGVSVNAITSGHKFSAVLIQPPTPFPPVPVPGTFPPTAPTSLADTIRSYLYQQYTDDEDLQAFVRAYNEMAQQYVTWFNAIGLPVYTGALISGALLDWVAEGLYGIRRPALSSGRNSNVGPFNTYPLNTIAFNAQREVGNQNIVATTDDVFKRIITWHFFKGDGKVFTISWLKRRIMRFLLGDNGTNPSFDNTYLVSVSFGPGSQVNIGLLAGLPLANATVFKEAIDSGALELPFQFTYNVTIG